MVLSGKISGIIFSSAGYSVVSVDPAGAPPFCAVGDFGGFQTGDVVELTGEWSVHKTHGRQFRVQVAVHPVPATALAIGEFLRHTVRGCGPKIAERIAKSAGCDFGRILETQPDMLLGIKGVNCGLLERIRASWNKNSIEKQVSLFLAEYQVGLGWTHKVVQRFGTEALRLLKGNPYRFIDIDGIGFKKADEIAERMGWDKTSPQRAEAILLYLMQEALGEGHVFLQGHELAARMRDSGVAPAITAAALATQTAAQKVAVLRGTDRGGNTGSYIYLPEMLAYETGLAAAVRARVVPGTSMRRPALGSLIAAAERELGVELTGPQRQAIGNAFEQGLSIVTGSPGTGKSTLVKVLTRVADNIQQSVLLVAPTGRAAKNLAGITGHPGATIHTALEYNPAASGWQRNRKNPLDEDLVVVDEASMIELEVGYHLFDAVARSSNILLIGDDNQLPSVGPGRVLNDLIESGAVPVVRLTTIHRQAARSQIVRNAQRVLEGRAPVFAPSDTDGHPTDCHLLQPPANLADHEALLEWVRSTVVDLVQRRLPARYPVGGLVLVNKYGRRVVAFDIEDYACVVR